MRLILVILLCFFISCNSSNKGTQKEIINIDLANFNNKSKQRELPFSTFFNQLEGFQISMECGAIGRIDKIVSVGDTLFFSDEKYSKQIIAFSRQGNYLYSIKNIGKGPGEFLSISDFAVSNNIVYISDNIQNKIIQYHCKSGKFISEKKIPFNISDLEVCNGYKYYATYIRDKEEYYIVIESPKGEVTNKYLSKKDYPFFKLATPKGSFFKYKDQVIYCHGHLTTIYKLYKDNCKPYIKINAGKYSMLERINNKPISIDEVRNPFLLRQQTISYFYNYFENDEFIYFDFSLRNANENICIYSKTNHNYNIYSTINMDAAHTRTSRFFSDNENNRAVVYSFADNTYNLKTKGLDSSNTKILKPDSFMHIDAEGNPFISIYSNSYDTKEHF